MRSFTRRPTPAGLAAVAGALLLASPASASLIINGGFEAAPVGIALKPTTAVPAGQIQDYFGNRMTSSQFLPGWTIADPGVSDLIRGAYGYALAPAYAAEGQQFLHLNWSPLGGITLDNTISQAFTLGAGSNRVSFSAMMAVENGFEQSTLQVSILNQAGQLVAQSGAFTHTAGVQTWSQKTWEADLAPGSYTITLRGIGAGNAWDVLLDDVKLDAVGGGNPGSAAPEPGAWALAILGFGMAGASLRRRRLRLA